jgi:hypothetical protein
MPNLDADELNRAGKKVRSNELTQESELLKRIEALCVF